MLDTQREAWERILPIAGGLREAVYQYVDRWPSAAFELEAVTGLRQSTVAARFAELANRKGKYDWRPRIFDSGVVKKNPETGRNAVVWNTTKPDDGQLDLFPEPRLCLAATQLGPCQLVGGHDGRCQV